MKKYLLLAATAALLASCTKESTVDPGALESQATQAISYGTYANINTKGKPITGNDGDGVVLEANGNAFDVVAYLKDGDKVAEYITGTTVTYNGGWKANKTAYWPSDTDQKLDFLALYPSGKITSQTYNKNTNNYMDMAFTGHTVPTTMTEQVDLMYGTSGYINEYNGDRKALINFKHALTQINFNVAVNDTSDPKEGYTLLVKNVSVGGVKTTGDFALTNGATTSCAWDNHATAGRYTAKATEGTTDYITIDATNDADGVKINDGKSGGNDGHSLMLVPQTFDAWDPTSQGIPSEDTTVTEELANGYIAVECVFYKEIGTGSDKIQVSLIGKYSTTAADMDFDTVYIPIASITDYDSSDTANTNPDTTNKTNTEWKAGRAITYNLTFGPSELGSGGGGYIPGTDPDDPETPKPEKPVPALAKIEYSTSVTNWVDYTPEENGDAETPTDKVPAFSVDNATVVATDTYYVFTVNTNEDTDTWDLSWNKGDTNGLTITDVYTKAVDAEDSAYTKVDDISSDKLTNKAGDLTIKVIFAENTANDDKTVDFKITNGIYSDSFTLTQEAAVTPAP